MERPLKPTEQTQTITATYADYAASLQFDHLPATVVHETKRSLLNWLSVAIGASRHPSVDKVVHVLSRWSGRDEAGVLGRSERLDIASAAFVNAFMSHVFDFDDTHARSILHPSAPTFPTVLALCEEKGLTGKDVILGYVAGFEIAGRIAAAVTPWHNESGWHVTGTIGTFSAAVAASKLLGLPAGQIQHAIGLAATQAAGLRHMFGAMAKSLHPGKAAWNGLMAASLAAEDFTSGPLGLEGRRGFLDVMTPDFRAEDLTAGLGQEFETLRNCYKPYACGVVTHAAIDAAIDARKAGILPERVERITAYVHPLVAELTGNPHPRTGLEGKFSVYHCISVGLIDGIADNSTFSDERVVAGDVRALRSKVSLVVEEAMSGEAARLVVQTTDGVQSTFDVHHARGTMDNPLTDSDIEEKFRRVTAGILGSQDVDHIIDLVWNLDGIDKVAHLVDHCRTL